MDISLGSPLKEPVMVKNGPPDSPALLTPSAVADLFRVHPRTVTRWAKAGKLNSTRTLGGHRRYNTDEVAALLADSTTPITD